MHTPPVMFVPISRESRPWSVATFRAMIKQGCDAGAFGKHGASYIAFLDTMPDDVITEELRFRDGPSLAQVMFERMLAADAQFEIRRNAPFTAIGRDVQEKKLRGNRLGGRPFGTGADDRDLDHDAVAKFYHNLHYIQKVNKREAAKLTYRNYWDDGWRTSDGRAMDKFAEKLERWVRYARLSIP